MNFKTALIGNEIIPRVVTDKGIAGYASIENAVFSKVVLTWIAKQVVGCDPIKLTDIMHASAAWVATSPGARMLASLRLPAGILPVRTPACLFIS